MSLTTTIDFLAPPDDATPLDTAPDPNAPIGEPDASIDLDTSAPDLPDVTGPSCSSWGTARWLNTKPPAGASNTNGYPYGTLNCPPDHWYKGYYYIDDHTGSAWPVHNYTSYWSNNVNGLTVGYGCPSSTHCVKVVEGRYGTYYYDSQGVKHARWLGLTSYTVDGHNRFVSVGVRFNDSWDFGTKNTVVRSEATCHELGHTAGLGHETKNVSCMNPVSDGTHTSGSSDDLNQLGVHTYGPGVRT
jgi:hypothetical protein